MASPILAALMSLLIPGLGQFYAGHLLRGLGIFLFDVIVAIATAFMGIPLVHIVAAIDAYYLAAKTNS